MNDENFWRKKCVIYLIENLLNGKKYVGQTRQMLRQRINQHKSHNKTYIDRAIKCYGFENFKVEILEECASPDELNEREIFWIKTLDTKVPNGYNRTDGGADIDNIASEMKLAVCCLNDGRIFESIVEAARYYNIPKTNISALCHGYRLNIGSEYRFEFVDEQKRAAAEIRRQKISQRNKPVRCIENGIIYESAVAASKATGIYRICISFACRHKSRTAGGYHWEFVRAEED